MRLLLNSSLFLATHSPLSSVNPIYITLLLCQQLKPSYPLDHLIGDSNVCGDGIIQDGEECDDGNTIVTDDCISMFTPFIQFLILAYIQTMVKHIIIHIQSCIWIQVQCIFNMMLANQ